MLMQECAIKFFQNWDMLLLEKLLLVLIHIPALMEL